jgi:hypothetical protein
MAVLEVPKETLQGLEGLSQAAGAFPVDAHERLRMVVPRARKAEGPM